MDKLEELRDWIDELNKPLVVPKGLGEWLAEQNLGNEKNLFGIIGGLEDMWVRGDFEEFIGNNKKKLIEVILGARPYELEKEKLYYVLNKQGKTLLMFVGEKVCVSSGYEIHDDNKGFYQFTEKQIKDYDKRYWAFAEEVAE